MSGLSVAMFLFLVSVGMSLIFGVTRIVNLAHGSFYMVGAYLLVTLVETLPQHPLMFWVVLGLAPIGVGLLGGVIEVTLLRRIYHREPLLQLTLTFGLILVIGTAVLLVWGPTTRASRARTRWRARYGSSGSRSRPTTSSCSRWRRRSRSRCGSSSTGRAGAC